MKRKLLGGAAGVVAVAGDAVRHAAWYLRYQLDGSPRREKAGGLAPPGTPPPHLTHGSGRGRH